MNFLSHFFIDYIPEDHYYNVGLIFPDISKRWVKSLKQPLPDSFSKEQHQLWAGSQQHYLSDKKFHSSSYFETFVHEFSQQVNNAGLSNAVQRKWFIAHIAFELMIDRLLVRNFPEKVDAFYHSLTSVDVAKLIDFLMYYGLSDKVTFSEFYERFSSVQYIYYYTDNNKFVYSLNRIMVRAGIPEMNEDDTNKLLTALLNLENNYFADVHSHVNRLKQVFVT